MKNNSIIGTLLAAAIIFSACAMADEFIEDIVDVSRLKVTTVPAGTGAIIPATQRELRVEFNLPVDMRSAEDTVSLDSPDGPVTCDLRRENRRLILTPVEPLQAGTRYVLSCRGTISAPDERTWQVDTECSFYIDTDDDPPVLVSFSPEEDASVSGNEPLVLRFNAPLNTENLARHLEISPEHPVVITASEQDHTLTITPERAWKGLTRYHWSVRETLRSASGVRLYRRYDGAFRTISDTTPPEKPEIFARPITSEDDLRLPPESLTNGCGLEFSFTEPVDPGSFTRKLTMEPYTTTIVRQLSQTAFLVYPDGGNWTAGEQYTITLEKGLEDLCGNRTGESFVFTVTPEIPGLHLLRFESDSPAPDCPAFLTADDLAQGIPVHQIAIDTLTNDPIALTLTLSLPLCREEAQRLVSSISLEPLFPRYLAPPERGPVMFNPDTDSRIIRLTWRGLEVPTREIDEERILYTFSIRGGKNGFTTDAGSFFPDTLSVILETRKKEEEP